MVYDAKRGVTVLFGGKRGEMSMRDTWEWDGRAWMQDSTSGPSARKNHAMAYDRFRGVTVMFGGDNTQNELGETWEWDGQSWTRRNGLEPSRRTNHAMAFDQDRGVCQRRGAGAVDQRAVPQ